MEFKLRLIFGIITAVSIIIKMQIHGFLDKKNDCPVRSMASANSSLIYLFPYSDKVKNSMQKLKKVCNLFWAIAVIAFIALLIVVTLN